MEGTTCLSGYGRLSVRGRRAKLSGPVASGSASTCTTLTQSDDCEYALAARLYSSPFGERQSDMPPTKSQAGADAASRRLSVTVPATHYSELVRLASVNKVSVAWLVRDAIERYLGDRQPLLRSEWRG